MTDNGTSLLSPGAARGSLKQTDVATSCIATELLHCSGDGAWGTAAAQQQYMLCCEGRGLLGSCMWMQATLKATNRQAVGSWLEFQHTTRALACLRQVKWLPACTLLMRCLIPPSHHNCLHHPCLEQQPAMTSTAAPPGGSSGPAGDGYLFKVQVLDGRGFGEEPQALLCCASFAGGRSALIA